MRTYLRCLQNGLILQILNSTLIQPPDRFCNEILKEAYKCHHNDALEYIQNNCLFDVEDELGDDVLDMLWRFISDKISKKFNCYYFDKII